MTLRDRIRSAWEAPTLREGVRIMRNVTPPQKRSQSYTGAGVYYNATQGGFQNPVSGAGTGVDKGEGGFFVPTRWYSRHIGEVIRVQSGAARKYIEMPIDEMFERWREWDKDENEQGAEAMIDAEKRHRVPMKVGNAIKTARQQGTGLLVLITKDEMLDQPLMPEMVRQGDLVDLRIYDRHYTTVWSYQTDPMMPGYYDPEVYYITPYRGGGFYVHASRCVRFDGIAPLQSDGFATYDQDWGVSILIPAITGLLQDAAIAQGAAHLANVASIPVLGVSGLRDAIAGSTGESDAKKVATDVNAGMSLYRLLMLDKETEEFDRIAVQFGGLNDLMERVERRLAANHIPPIPFTKWQGESPGGLSSTGEGEERNWLKGLSSLRKGYIDELDMLDEVLARDAGLREVPEFEWPSLIEMGDKERAEVEKIQAETAKLKAEAVGAAITAATIDEDEGKDVLREDPLFEDHLTDAPAPGPPDPDPMMMPGPNGANGAVPAGANGSAS